jgi:hypothetical protein
MVFLLYYEFGSDKKQSSSVAKIQHLFFDNKWYFCYTIFSFNLSEFIMFSQSTIDNHSDEELISLIQTIAQEVEDRLSDTDDALDYANSLSILVDSLRDRLSDRLDEEQDR